MSFNSPEYHAYLESKLQLAKDVYENGPKNNDPDSLLLAEHFADLKQQELELKQQPNYAKLVADDFTEDFTAELNAIQKAIQYGWVDKEIWNTNRLFKTVIWKFNKVVAVNFLFLSILTEITPFLDVSKETQEPFLVLISAPPKI